MLNQSMTPLYEQLMRHSNRNTVSFHVPGHKSGIIYKDDRDPFLKTLSSFLKIDLTEIPGLDDLHQPEGAIMEAEQLAAELSGAHRTFFLVGGSTSGNLALILSLCEPGDWIITERTAHKSIINGLMLARANAAFIESCYQLTPDVTCGVDLHQLKLVLDQYPQAKAVFLTNPNYYGLGQDLKNMIKLVHERGIPVLIDEAHGAHYGFHPKLPSNAIQAGADAVVQSPHKMLLGMTMTGLLHLNSDRISESDIARVLSMIQSSSPSYPLLASIDLSRRFLAEHGSAYIEMGLNAVNDFRRKMDDLPSFSLNPGDIRLPLTQDPFKILIRDRTGTLNGSRLQLELNKEGCIMELYQNDFVLAVFTLASTKEDAQKLYQALKNIQDRFQLQNKAYIVDLNMWDSVDVSRQFRQSGSYDIANFDIRNQTSHKQVPLNDSVGFRCSSMITPYPPGIPILFPGEWITEKKLHALQKLIDNGIYVQGLKKNNEQQFVIEVFHKES